MSFMVETIIIVNTAHVRSDGFRCNPGSKWWSHKFNGPDASFEGLSDLVDDKIR